MKGRVIFMIDDDLNNNVWENLLLELWIINNLKKIVFQLYNDYFGIDLIEMMVKV